jgi:hypothetical protein
MQPPVPTPDKSSTELQPEPARLVRPREIGTTAVGEWTARLLLMAAGLGFLVGFFMPWVTLGSAAQVSGLGLMSSQGELIDLFTGPYRFLLFSVPVLGTALLIAAVSGRRVAVWLALFTGTLTVLGGLYTVIRMFLSATGLGMWMVVISALISLAIGLLTIGRSRR